MDENYYETTMKLLYGILLTETSYIRRDAMIMQYACIVIQLNVH